MKLTRPSTELSPSTQLRKAVIGGCLLVMWFATNCPANYWGYHGIIQNQTYQLEFIPVPQMLSATLVIVAQRST